jgi:hypothetical protein
MAKTSSSQNQKQPTFNPFFTFTTYNTHTMYTAQDSYYLDYDDFAATAVKGGGKRGTAAGSKKDKNSRGTIYSTKHTRIQETQRHNSKRSTRQVSPI